MCRKKFNILLYSGEKVECLKNKTKHQNVKLELQQVNICIID